jgi:hypothetical protein
MCGRIASTAKHRGDHETAADDAAGHWVGPRLVRRDYFFSTRSQISSSVWPVVRVPV